MAVFCSALWSGFSPPLTPRCDIGQNQAVKELTVHPGAAVCDQVRFDKPWLRIVPFGERADRHVVLQQPPCPGRSNPALATLVANWIEQPVDSRRADAQQLCSDRFAQRQVAVTFQHFDEHREERDQSLGADPVGRLPDERQHVPDVGSVRWAPDPSRLLLGCLRCTAPEPGDDILAMKTGRGGQLVQDPAFLPSAGLSVPIPDARQKLLPRSQTHGVPHPPSPVAVLRYWVRFSVRQQPPSK